MRTKLFLAAMAAIAVVGCNKNSVETPAPSLEGPSAMLKVNIKSKTTKAYEVGTAEENAVSSVNFYFYNAAGQPYSVVPGSNEIEWIAAEAGSAENIEAVSDVVLVIKQAETTPPAKVVAILNDATDYSNVALADLGNQVVKSLYTVTPETETAGAKITDFVMSNSVYYNEGLGTVMVASEITQENIFVDPDYDGEAGAKYEGEVEVTPIDIYVERVAAKVTVAFPAENVPVKDENGKTMVDSEGNEVYADFTGWNVTNATDEAYLVKNLDAPYAFNWTWNAPADFRSFWAETTDTPEHKHTFTALEGHTQPFDYYFENTAEEASQLLVAARLVNQEGENISLAKWYNVLYTVADAKTAVANTLANKLYILEGDKLVSVTADDITFYQREYTADDNRYEVLVEATEGTAYYKPALVEDKPVAYTDAELAAIFEAVEPIQMWEEGMTYYYVTINHVEGAAPAIVRNHQYNVTVKGVMGFGTPVYDPSQIIIPEPVDPQDALNLAAEINVLSWNIVSQDVVLGN